MIFSYPGALHIHSIHSDGTGTLPEIVAAAWDAGLRWIIVTDHDTLAGRSYAGWHDGVLVIVDHEITPDRNHFLALGVDQVISHQLPPQEFIDQTYASGGFGIIAHPDEQVVNRFKDCYRWDDWTIDGPRERADQTVGLELWNLMSDWGEHLTQRNQFLHFCVPGLGLSGPSPATLAWWDRLNMTGRRTFGVGGVDAHAFRRKIGWYEIEIFPYRWLFQTLTNYLQLTEPLSNDATEATQQVYAALRQGQSYFINRREADLPALHFVARRNGHSYRSGDTASLAQGPLHIEVDVQRNADLRLIANGYMIAHGVRQLRHTITSPGVYRLEAYIGSKSWLFANPIYVA